MRPVTDPKPEVAGDGIVTIPAGSSWPLGIIIGLLIVVAVNIAFIYVAVSGADEVVPSYTQSDR